MLAIITPGSVTDEWKCSYDSPTDPESRTQQHIVIFWLQFTTITIIKLMGVRSVLHLFLQNETLHLLFITMIHLLISGCDSLMGVSLIGILTTAAAVYILVSSIVCDSASFYTAGTLLFLIFGGYNKPLGNSSVYRSVSLPYTGPNIDVHNTANETTGTPRVEQCRLPTLLDQLDAITKSTNMDDIPKNKHPDDAALVQLPMPELENIQDVLKGMSRLPALCEDFHTEVVLHTLDRLFDGFDASLQRVPTKPEDFDDIPKEMSAPWELHEKTCSDSALHFGTRTLDNFDISIELRDAKLKLESAMMQQKSTIGNKWTPEFNEGPLHDVQYLKRQAGLEGVMFLLDGEASDPLDPNDSADGWSDDRSIAGDTADIDWFHFFLQKDLHPKVAQILEGATRHAVVASRSERTGLNAMIQYLETVYHRLNGKYTSMEALFKSLKVRAHEQSSLQPYLTGQQMVAINEGCADYNFDNDVSEVCDLLSYLTDNPEYEKIQGTNSVVSWVADVDQHELFSPHEFLTCACGAKAMDLVLHYRDEQEHIFAIENIRDSFCELEFLDLEALDDEYERKEKEDEYEAIHGRTTPLRCREIRQVCDVHAIPTNNIWVLLDDSTRDLNQYLEPVEDSSLPAPGMYHLTSYSAGFRLPQRFLQIEYEKLCPRCAHGHLHPPAFEYCVDCFPDGQHFDCAECESHLLLQKPVGQDIPLVEHREIECMKLQIDERLMDQVYTARVDIRCFSQWEVDTADRPMRHDW